MEPIPLEDLALLEVLQRVDQSMPLQSGDTEIRQRLIDTSLAEQAGDLLRLTPAGVEMCKSLQHRVAADTQVARLQEQRKGNGAAHGNVAGESAALTE